MTTSLMAVRPTSSVRVLAAVVALLLAGCVTSTHAGDEGATSTSSADEAATSSSESPPASSAQSQAAMEDPVASAEVADEAVVSTDALFPDDTEAFTTDWLEMLSADVGSNPEVGALGAVAWLAEGTVLAIEDAPADLEGAMVLTFEIDGIAWEDEIRWNLGRREPVVAPDAGATVRLLTDDIWQLAIGNELLAAVAVEPNPDGAYDGFAEFLAEPDGRVLPARAGVVEVRRALADRLRETGGKAAEKRSSRRAALLELLEDASDRIDALNTGDEDAPVPGLLGEVVGSARDSEAAEGVPFGEQDPDWRQLPLSVEEEPDVEEAVPGRVAQASVMVLADLDPLPTFVALQLPGAGIVGPVNVDEASSSAVLDPVMPVRGSVRVLGWYDDEPSQDTATELSELQPLGSWDPEADGLVVEVDAGGADINPMPLPAFEAELLRIAELGAAPPTGEP